MLILPSPFLDSGAALACGPDEAAASLPQMPSGDAAAEILCPGGYPLDEDECKVCGATSNMDCPHWPADDISNIGEIFNGARKLEPVEMWFENTAYPREDELLYEVLLAMDNPHAPDLIDMPYGMEGIFDPPPLFLRRA